MKHRMALGALVVVAVLVVVMVAPAAALPDKPASMNARMTRFQERAAVIHLLVFQDDGRLGVPAYVDAGQPLLFGFELSGPSDDPGNYFTVSVDGGDAMDIYGYYQSAFEAETQSGPAWSWDHDGDGPGDGDGDGVGDWSGTIVFFRYPHPGMAAGTHAFEFALQWEGIEYSDTIIVEALE